VNPSVPVAIDPDEPAGSSINTPRPNPGSDAAITAGCICAVLDNCHGRFAPIPAGTALGGETGAWYITVGCPIHAPVRPDPIAEAVVGVDKTLGQTYVSEAL
jgi:hypothetical protein